MATHILSEHDQLMFIEMAMQGLVPQDLADFFNISVSSVHNYKKYFQNKGKVFPNVHGKRATGNYRRGEASKPKAKETLDLVAKQVALQESSTEKNQRLLITAAVSSNYVSPSPEVIRSALNIGYIEFVMHDVRFIVDCTDAAGPPHLIFDRDRLIIEF